MAGHNEFLLQLVEEQLQASGYVRAASALVREGGVAASPAPAGSPAAREAIYEAILQRDAAGALRVMRSRYTHCMTSRPEVAAELLLQCVCDAMLRGEPDAAVAVVGTQLLPLADAEPEGGATVARGALEAASALLAFPAAMLADAAQLPASVARLLSGHHRAAVASRVHAALLQADGVTVEPAATVLVEAVLAADAAIGAAAPPPEVPGAAAARGVVRGAVAVNQTGDSGRGSSAAPPAAAAGNATSGSTGVGGVEDASGGSSPDGSGGRNSAARHRVAPHVFITGGLRHGV